MHSSNTSSMVFPRIKMLPEALGHSRLRSDVLAQIEADPDALYRFKLLESSAQEALLEFCMGNRSVKITYDPFFQHIFHPLHHPERLNRFLSSILNRSVTVKDILPREGTRLSAESSLMVMDILVELEDGTLVNVEMQRIGYDFPIQRGFCYGADLLVRQYNRSRYLKKELFTYKDLKPVIIIVLMEDSPSTFSNLSNTYMHTSRTEMDSGLPLENLLNFIYISLDNFLKMPHNELTEAEAWLYFLSSDNPLHIQRITEKYPFFKELYQDIINFRYHPKELITMYSDTLQILDRNTVQYMIDELQRKLDNAIFEKDSALSAKVAALSKMDAALSEMDAALSEKDAALSEKDAALSEMDAALSEKDAALSEKDAALSEMDAALSEKDAALSEKDAEIARLTALLAEKNKNSGE